MSQFDDMFSPAYFGTQAGAGSTGIASAQDLMFAPQAPIGGLETNGVIPGIPSIGPLGSSQGGIPFMDKANLALSGLSTLGNLWGAFEARNLAKKQFKFSKEFAEKNYSNQMKSYNTALEDKGRSRAAVEDQSSASLSDYIKQNKLG